MVAVVVDVVRRRKLTCDMYAYLRMIIHSASANASADLSADMPKNRFIKLKILLKHSRML